MTLENMIEEKQAIGKQAVKSAIASIGSISLSVVSGLPLYFFFTPNTKNIKRNVRLS